MVKISEIELPLILRERVLFKKGFRNGMDFRGEVVSDSFLKTKWTNLNSSIFELHSSADRSQKPVRWVGRVDNLMERGGEIIGDVYIHDSDWAYKIGTAKAPVGLSAELDVLYNDEGAQQFDIERFALVSNPEVKEAFFNFSEDGKGKVVVCSDVFNEKMTFSEKEKKEDLAKVSNREEVRKKLGATVSEFYAAPRDPPSSSALPIFDAARVRNAIARFNQTKFLSDSEKAKAKKKILAAAKKFKIEVSEDSLK